MQLAMMRSTPMLSAGRQAVSARRSIVRASAESTTPTTDVVAPKKYTLTGKSPTRFTPAEGQMGSIAGASLAPVLRAGVGIFGYGYKAELVPDDPSKYSVFHGNGQMLRETSETNTFKRPALPLELYEFEGCPFCKKAREAVTLLDLDVIIRPCPRDGETWRPKANMMGGKKQFPFLVDPNTNKQMYESDDIVKYLFNEYGPGEENIPFMLNAGFLTTLTCGLAALPRWGRGNIAVKGSRLPAEPLVMYMYEGSPFVKVVREVLCELEVPYKQITCSRGSSKRQEVQDKYGAFQVPLMEDPNTGIAMFESADIIAYLQKTYGPESWAPAAPSS